MWRTTSTKPMTAEDSMSSSSSTPAARIREPPMPARCRPGRKTRSSAATPAAWRSPDASPADNRTSVTSPDWAVEVGTPGCPRAAARDGLRGGHQQLPFDLSDDAERDGQRIAAIFAGDGHRLLAPNGRHETLQLQLERLPFRCIERHPLDEGVDLDGPPFAGERTKIDFAPQPVELARARGQIERQIPAGLEDPDLAQPLLGHPARRDIGDGSAREREARVGDVDG